jgi:prophage DNA circulation protein
VVPAVSLQLRDRLQAVITKRGLTLERQAEVMGRAATELAIIKFRYKDIDVDLTRTRTS